MKRSRNNKESGFALISALALLATLSLLIASAVVLTQYSSAEVDTFDSINRSYYAAESAANQMIMLLAQDRAKNVNRNLGQPLDAQVERFMADGRTHTLEIYGQSVTVQIFDAMRGLDVSGTNPSRQLSFTTIDSELKEKIAILANRLDDYADTDDLVRINSMERSDYQNQNIPLLPRNRPLEFKEELRLIPGFTTHYPISENGHFDVFRLIAPEKLKPLRGRPNLYATPLSLLIERCNLRANDAEILQQAFTEWREQGKVLTDILPPGLLAKLTTYFNTMESGIYTIRINTASNETPGSMLTATLLIDFSTAKIEYYEFIRF